MYREREEGREGERGEEAKGRGRQRGEGGRIRRERCRVGNPEDKLSTALKV